MNYEEMSDFDIDGAVLTALGYVKLTSGDGYVVYLDQLRRKEVGAKTSKKFNFNPCNNPSDAWPIIDSIFWQLTSADELGVTEWARLIRKEDCSDKLRAAMIVFLMMKDAECQKP